MPLRREAAAGSGRGPRDTPPRPGHATRYCRLAAEQAERHFAYHEAARLWEQAITCFDQADHAPVRERLELVLGLVRALSHSGPLARARALRSDAVRAALPPGGCGRSGGAQP
ncbi:MAG: hypothetical protein ACRDP5_07100 [Streptosporangiaceae bacterium]